MAQLIRLSLKKRVDERGRGRTSHDKKRSQKQKADDDGQKPPLFVVLQKQDELLDDADLLVANFFFEFVLGHEFDFTSVDSLV